MKKKDAIFFTSFITVLTFVLLSFLETPVNKVLAEATSWLNTGNHMYSNVSGYVGIGTTAPGVKLHVYSGTPATLSSGGYLMIGNQASSNLIIDNNEISARNNGVHSDLYLQALGSTTSDTIINPNGGLVGIRTNDPLTTLHLGTGGPTLRLGDASVADGGQIEWRTTSARHWNIDQNNDTLRFFTENTSDGVGVVRMAISENGKLGLGIDTPGTTLHVYNGSPATLTGGGYIMVGDQGAANIIIDNNEISARNNGSYSDLYLQALGTNRNTIINPGNGKIGLGTTDPDEKLEVNGNIKLNGNIVSDGNICIGNCN
ncbi:hypothetical protein A2X44_02410 [candidate division CPR3 bacterium GWF2_35_18]|uniref:Uncharacterized protein n=1 Tax=candidate division CPR3 bacterium GW2011_GWF2_35_18 TaxID=1618350 RepID=A0A0G0E3X7_UNCC3|nr:MAG: hypothetical protein UR67_C0002G0165 [candidate division CPR3 bacterium GW2011_GWF2_35_18]KKP85053.1 MAG: hypothetical protein UR87_C0061G0010 [candidate division CPR3 bacterium GW2011_GWE2_35_7]OGB62848.1 MAG: hypothetical protein A2X44_02410 [candidate division CPR3 bacterium GWF2_35_18]OGB65429.1 MAG: hypothetical protein A2250_00625 [candidate division CPR3 bacterium RIFOXYA2_FULL_35_13]OGB79539.1 MAG: hypothetical protein A2296_00415 [candidate division CPR3 bacterium RIFOXYB2_FULL